MSNVAGRIYLGQGAGRPSSKKQSNSSSSSARKVLGALSSNQPRIPFPPVNKKDAFVKPKSSSLSSAPLSASSPKALSTSSCQTEASLDDIREEEKILTMTTVNYKELAEKRRKRSAELLKENDELLEEVAHYQSINESLNETREEIESELEELVSQRDSLNSLITEAKDIAETLTSPVATAAASEAEDSSRDPMDAED